MKTVFGPRFLSGPAIPLAIGFLVLIGISTASVWLGKRSEQEAELVAHTMGVENRLASLQLLIRRAESGQRGYLLTGGDGYRAAYDESARALPQALNELREATVDNPRQTANIDRLKPVLDEKLAEMGETVRLYTAGNPQGAVDLVRTDRGRELMTALTSVVADMRVEEAQLLQHRRADSAWTNTILLLANLLGAVVIIAVAAVAIRIVVRSNRALRDTQIKLAEANEGLEAAVIERTADLQEANDEIQRFAYIVSHDLRSPLVNIMGFTTELEALRDDVFSRLADLRQAAPDMAAAPAGSPGSVKDADLAQDFDEALGFIKASINKMDRLINAILNLSRQGRRTFKPERVDMDALLQTIRDSMTHQSADASAEIILNKLPAVQSDRLALEQIFSNLLDNAVKYLRPGVAGRIEVRGRSGPSGLIYEVRDNGRGIDPKDRERVFELFRRSGVQDRPGEGIGLAHVRTLVRRLGGNIALTSEFGQGSTFTITLPRRWAGETREEAA